MKVFKTKIPDLLILEPDVFGDNRGYFLETYQQNKYTKLGLNASFVQDNMSFSRKGTLRGLHIQNPAQGKLVQVLDGIIFDVAVDLRKNSPTFGEWYGIELNSISHEQFWIPAGFAHGFYVMSETALFSYKCTDYYNPKGEISLLWNDPDIGIKWPLSGQPLISEKDANAKSLRWFIDAENIEKKD